MDFQNRTVILTGASRGIGRATALRLAKEGANLALLDIKEEELAETAALAREYGHEVETYLCDVSNEERVHEVVDAVAARFGRIDALINNAGLYDTWEPFLTSKSSTWKKKIDVNILGTMYCAQAVLPYMLEKGYGRIVNISSVVGVYGSEYMADYAMTKGAVIAFTASLARAVTGKGITVNAVAPGTIIVKESNFGASSYAGRGGEPEECASLIVYLASDEASYISGQNYQVDGCRKMI